MKKIAVMAGTLVDTQMGVDLLKNRCPEYIPISYPTASNPREQNAFQLGTLEHRIQTVRTLIQDAKNEDAKALFVYCNSLSGSLDFKMLCQEEQIPLITPLAAHQDNVRNKKRIGLIAANNQSLHGLESAMFEANPNCDILGLSLLPMVVAIEQQLAPETILKEFALSTALDYFYQNHVDCVALGCTHFSYIFEALQKISHLPIFNPDDAMIEKLHDYLQ